MQDLNEELNHLFTIYKDNFEEIKKERDALADKERLLMDQFISELLHIGEAPITLKDAIKMWWRGTSA